MGVAVYEQSSRKETISIENETERSDMVISVIKLI